MPLLPTAEIQHSLRLSNSLIMVASLFRYVLILFGSINKGPDAINARNCFVRKVIKLTIYRGMCRKQQRTYFAPRS
mgnify:CR=1 FL=1